MMLSENDIKEELSYAYLHALASRAGFGIDRTTKDRDSIDVTLSARGWLAEESRLMSPKLDFQLKATSQIEVRETDFAFRLPLKNYDDLRQVSMVPRLLLVLLLPEDPGEWLQCTEDSLISKRCAHWLSLKGMPATTNETSQTVYLAKANLLTLDSLKELMLRASRQEELRNEL
jgi:hypothetical protein